MILRRIAALRQRYAAVHAERLGGVSFGPPFRRVGRVERVALRDGALQVSGWADVSELRVVWAGGSVAVTGFHPRADVARRRGHDRDTGFEVSLPPAARPVRVDMRRHDGARFGRALAHPEDPAPFGPRARLTMAFLRDALRALPLVLRHAVCPGDRPRLRQEIKRALGLEVLARGGRLDGAWLARGPRPRRKPGGAVTILLPVFNAHALLQQCLARVEAHTDLPWHLIVVEDASTDPALRPWLRDWAATRPDRVTVLEHSANMGFVASVNDALAAALDRAADRPVILLNTDAMVPEGWAGRLVAPLRDPSVASVTPMSNAAEILSVPAIGPGCALAPGEGDIVDRAARRLAPLPAPDLPTGVGFCMALSPRWLARVPRLDPAFGRGYGEEVDWCRRTRAMGARHKAAPDLFVEHVGGQSFGSAEKALRLRDSARILARRYPEFDAEVHAFIAEDPLATPRLALAVALAAARADVLPIYLAHSLGGGAEVALMAEVARHPAAVVLRVGGPARWQLEVHLEDQCHAGQTDDLTLVRRLLASAPRREVIYSCGVGDPDPVALPGALLSLLRPARGDRLALRIHDYFPLSPSYCLLGQDGRHRGVPMPGDPDPAHTIRRPDGRVVPLGRWRAAWSSLVAAADEVTVFSAASAALVRAAYPDARLCLRPHRLAEPPAPVRIAAPRPGSESRGRLRSGPGVPAPALREVAPAIGILGNLNLQKGAHVLARIAERQPGRRFVVIGLVDSRIALPRNVSVHGAYLPEEISPLAERHGIGGWLMPAIWPETFSFVTHEALATGLPVAGFALGGQGEALDRAPNGATVPLDPDATAPERLFAALERRMEAGSGDPAPRRVAAR